MAVYHQIVQCHRSRTHHHGSGEYLRGESAHVARGRIDAANLGAQQQICECAVAGIPQRPQPPDEQRRGVQQVGQVADQQPHDADRRAVALPHDPDTQQCPAQAPSGDGRQQQPVGRHQQDDHRGRHHVHPPQPAALRSRGTRTPAAPARRSRRCRAARPVQKAPARAGQDASGGVCDGPSAAAFGRRVENSRHDVTCSSLSILYFPWSGAPSSPAAGSPVPDPRHRELVTLIRTATSTSTDPSSSWRSTAARISDTWTLTLAAWYASTRTPLYKEACAPNAPGGAFHDLQLRRGHRRGVRRLRRRHAVLGSLQSGRIVARRSLRCAVVADQRRRHPPPPRRSAAPSRADTDHPSSAKPRWTTVCHVFRYSSATSVAGLSSVSWLVCSCSDTATDSSGASSASVGFSWRVPASPSIRRLLGYSNC